MTVWNGSQRPVVAPPQIAEAEEFSVTLNPLSTRNEWFIYGPDGKGDKRFWAKCTNGDQAQFICDLLNGERPLMQALMALRVMGGLRPAQQEEIGRVLAKAGMQTGE